MELPPLRSVANRPDRPISDKLPVERVFPNTCTSNKRSENGSHYHLCEIPEQMFDVNIYAVVCISENGSHYQYATY
jgi:hypothetical protein